ncbi:MAG: hypothetical protein O3A55_06690 [Bacteroidetes bacterium]|nr:hypothetical protein [Bacteroidota bacterium]
MEDKLKIFLDITDHVKVFELLQKLNSTDKPIFGIMTPQHMVEHLIFTLQISNGEKEIELYYNQEKADKFKRITIYSDRELVRGFKSPALPKDEVLPLAFQNLEIAINNLKTELIKFDSYFKINQNSKPINPVMGELNFKEWIIFHNKHFTHHFKQFNLLRN